jgi:hypothetical protein
MARRLLEGSAEGPAEHHGGHSFAIALAGVHIARRVEVFDRLVAQVP